jgi:hypothetical protein
MWKNGPAECKQRCTEEWPLLHAHTMMAITMQHVQVFGCAHGRPPFAYPWEGSSSGLPMAWKRSRLRSQLLPCLARDPAQRPTAAAVLARVMGLGQATTMGTMPAPPAAH